MCIYEKNGKNKFLIIKKNAFTYNILHVLGCQIAGVYGDSCAKQCPINCRGSVCHLQMGTCFGCVSGWKGTTCNTRMIEITIHYLSF